MNLTNTQLRFLFVEFLDGLNPKLKHFTGSEISTTYQSIKHGAFNSAPPVHLWSNILPTIRILDDLRGHLGYPIHLTSIYRNDAYNKAVGGSSDSMHKYFNAVDFYSKSGTPHEWHAGLTWLQEQGKAEIGGLKAYSSFVHLDTRQHLGRKVWMP